MSRGQAPQTVIDDLSPETTKPIVRELRGLNAMGPCKTDEEVEGRINDYFEMCERTGLRPGIETLCFSLHISRTTLFNWIHGNGCTVRRQEIVQNAKGFISAFIEQVLLSGKISPPSGIFIMKNWLGYKDTVGIEETIPTTSNRVLLSVDDLPKFSCTTNMDNRQTADQLPRFSDDTVNN